MNPSNQKTLFQTWGHNNARPSTSNCSSLPSDIINDAEFDDDEDDLVLAQVMEESVREYQESINKSALLGTGGAQPSTSCFQVPTEEIKGFDINAGQTWIYPTNYSMRDYQYNIVEQVLYTNTLVSLPTGLGKTFIAAVVMYNFYRWYPLGKIIFMAPTKPLVAQQIEACFNIMGIPQEDTAQMTGELAFKDRAVAWKNKRVFFLTPQIMQKDMSRDAFSIEQVKCLVIDEAHKATGNHAYVEVVKELLKHTSQFRVLALSATPGSDIKAVQQVLTNLLIAKIEFRTEDSADIIQYSYERKIEKIIVPPSVEMNYFKYKYLKIIEVVAFRLMKRGVLPQRDLATISKYSVLKQLENFKKKPPANISKGMFHNIQSDFCLCISLYHGFELLMAHGIQSAYNFLKGIVDGEKGHPRARAELISNPDFMELIEQMKEDVNISSSSLTDGSLESILKAHPKLAKLEDIVLKHFKNTQNGEDNVNTRIMIFSQYRDSVQQITKLLSQHRPLVKVMSFIGHSTGNKSTKGFTNKEQLRIVNQFREGGYNTLVATCVGEEGLDIGDVDLIICFDSPRSPIRMIQRMGRTGRQRQGRIVMLLTAGKEEKTYNEGQYSKRRIHNAIEKAKGIYCYKFNPRMIPNGLTPRVYKMFLAVGPYQVQTKLSTKNKSGLFDKKFKDGFLNNEELTYWSKHFKIDESEIPIMADSNFLSLKNSKEQIEDKGNRPLLSLSAWLPWQNRLQQHNLVSHSLRTEHLVELIEFVEVSSHLDPKEDAYGTELALYLDKNDILKPGKKDNFNPKGIKKFFAVTAEKNETVLPDDMKSGSKRKPNDLKKRKRPLKSSKSTELLPADKDDENGMSEIKKIKRRRIMKIMGSDDDDAFASRQPGMNMTNHEKMALSSDEEISQSLLSEKIITNKDHDQSEASPEKIESQTNKIDEPSEFNSQNHSMPVASPDKNDSQEKEFFRSFCSIRKLIPRIHSKPLTIRPPPTFPEIWDRKLNLSPVDILDIIDELENERISSNTHHHFNQGLENTRPPSKMKTSIASDSIYLNFKLDFQVDFDETPLKSSPGRENETCNSIPVELPNVNTNNLINKDRLPKTKLQTSPEQIEIFRNSSTSEEVKSISEKLESSGNVLKEKVFCNKEVKKPSDNILPKIYPYEPENTLADSAHLLSLTQRLKCVSNYVQLKPVAASNNTQLKPVPDKPQLTPFSNNTQLQAMSDNTQLKLVSDNPQLIAFSSNSKLPAVSDNSFLNATCDNALLKIECSNNDQLKTVLDNIPLKHVTDNTQLKTICVNTELKSPIIAQLKTPNNSKLKTPFNNAQLKTPPHKAQLLTFSEFFSGKSAPNNGLIVNKSSISQIKTPFSIPEIQTLPKNAQIKTISNDIQMNIPLVRPQIEISNKQNLENSMMFDSPVTLSQALSLVRSQRGKDSDNTKNISVKKNIEASEFDYQESFIQDKKTSPLVPKEKCKGLDQEDEKINFLLNDIDDWIDEDIVPPSPKAKHPSSSSISQLSKNNVRNILEFCDIGRKKTSNNILTQDWGKSTSSPLTVNIPLKDIFVKTNCNDTFVEVKKLNVAKVLPQLRMPPDESPVNSKSSISPVLVFNITSDEESPLIRKKVGKVSAIKSSESDGFSTPKKGSELRTPSTGCRNLSIPHISPVDTDLDFQESTHLPKVQRRSLKPEFFMKEKKICPFIDDEAEVCNDDDILVSSDEDENNMDTMEDSFICNDPLTQRPRDQGVPDMQSIYLQSIKSPQLKKFLKLGARNPHQLDVFSQPESAVESNYLEDSFCVGDDCVESDDDNASPEEISPLLIKKTEVRPISKGHAFIPAKELKRRNVIASTESESEDEDPYTNTTSFLLSKNNDNNSKTSVCIETPNLSPEEKLRQERLKRQKEQQEEFRKRMSLSQNDKSNKASPSTVVESRSQDSCYDGLTILVDSKELSNCQNLLSSLRMKHKIKVTVCSRANCDYIVSNRMGVERKLYSDFSHGANRIKLIERVQNLCDTFERPCLVIEKDRLKPKEIAKPKNKYVDYIVAELSQTVVSLLYSDCQEETADILAFLAQSEKSKQQAISVPIELNKQKEQIFQFYQSLPKVSYVSALNLCHNFQSIQGFFKSSPAEMKLKGKLSQIQVHEIRKYLRHHYNFQMTANTSFH